MSSSVGYNYSYVDIEAQRRRQLRGEIAELRQQLADLRSQVAGLRGSRRAANRSEIPKAGRDATAQQLEAVADVLRAAIVSTRGEVDQALTEHWERRVGAAFKADQGTRRAPGTAAEELARQRAAERATPAPQPAADKLEAVVGEAEALVAAEAHRCDPAGLDVLRGLLAELRSLDQPAAARQQAFQIRAVVTESIRRRERDHKAAVVRARLLTLVEEALPEDREQLRALIDTSPDPGGLTGQVASAIDRADKVRTRQAVAQATADALREIGCEVGESFVTLLAEGDGAVAAFDQAMPDYGLVVRLPERQTKLVAAVVRRADVAGSPERDREAQERFCAGQLEEVVGRLHGRIGLSPTPFVRMAPGQLPVAEVDAARWPHARSAEVTHTGRRTSTTSARPQSRPKAGERHNGG